MLEKVIEIIKEQLNLEGVEVTEDSSFKDDLGADSLDPVSYTHLPLPIRRRMCWRPWRRIPEFI